MISLSRRKSISNNYLIMITIVIMINKIDICTWSHHSLNYYVYSDSSHSALKYLKDTEVNIDNVLIITGDFNINWDP